MFLIISSANSEFTDDCKSISSSSSSPPADGSSLGIGATAETEEAIDSLDGTCLLPEVFREDGLNSAEDDTERTTEKASAMDDCESCTV